MMRRIVSPLACLRDDSGAVMIETAIVAPVLLLMSVGAFQVSDVIARQTELQGAVAEASAIALAAPPETADQRATLKSVIVSSTNLASDKVVVSERFRCGNASGYVDSASACIGVKVSSYVLIELTDRYTPVWTKLGVGTPIDYHVNRYVMVKQS